MKQTDFLQLQLAVLIHQYGQHALLKSLASLRGLTTNDLQNLLIDIEKVNQPQTKKPQQTQNPIFKIDVFLKKHPEKSELIHSIKLLYDNKTFLPELKDVRRFLDRHGQPTKALKTRSDAFSKVIRVLVDLPTQDLEAILNTKPNNEFSDLGIISDQILGRE